MSRSKKGRRSNWPGATGRLSGGPATIPGAATIIWAILHYGTDPHNLNQLAKSHIRLNQSHPDTIFRVRVLGLNPGTTYYYTVDSMEATSKSDGVKSPIASFTTLQ